MGQRLTPVHSAVYGASNHTNLIVFQPLGHLSWKKLTAWGLWGNICMGGTVQRRSEAADDIYKQLRQILYCDLFYGQFLFYFWVSMAAWTLKLFASLCESNSYTAGQEKLQACKRLLHGDILSERRECNSRLNMIRTFLGWLFAGSKRKRKKKSKPVFYTNNFLSADSYGVLSAGDNNEKHWSAHLLRWIEGKMSRN